MADDIVQLADTIVGSGSPQEVVISWTAGNYKRLWINLTCQFEANSHVRVRLADFSTKADYFGGESTTEITSGYSTSNPDLFRLHGDAFTQPSNYGTITVSGLGAGEEVHVQANIGFEQTNSIRPFGQSSTTARYTQVNSSEVNSVTFKDLETGFSFNTRFTIYGLL